MSVLLAPDAVDLLQAAVVEDSHGWADATPGGVRWSGMGNLQLAQPSASAAASETGGSGPYTPRHVEGGTLYLDDGCPVQSGDLLRVHGRLWIAESVQIVLDPTRGTASALAVLVTERDEVAVDG